jgi:hypothetical protein
MMIVLQRYRRLSSDVHHPPFAIRRSSSIECRPSIVVCHRSVAIHHLWGIVRHPSVAIGHPLVIICHLSFVVRRSRSVTVYRSSLFTIRCCL